jgi:hypothetical protein
MDDAARSTRNKEWNAFVVEFRKPEHKALYKNPYDYVKNLALLRIYYKTISDANSNIEKPE